MKYKYVFSKESDGGQFIIREYAELSKEIFSTVCESSCEIDEIEAAVGEGLEAVWTKMRTRNFFPPGNFLERIVQGVTELILSGEQSVMEIYCDDTEFLTKSSMDSETLDKLDDSEDDDPDDFIDDDLPDDFDGKVKSGVSKGSVDIDDDMMDDDDEDD